MSKKSRKNGEIVIFRAWRIDKDGKRLYARDYGHKAWRIVLKEKDA